MRYTNECIVVRSLNYQDADRIYTLLSREKGKISAIAKGVRKISSKRSGNLDTLSHASIGISESPQGFKTITEVKLLNSFKEVKAALETSKHAYYILELIHKFIEEGQEAEAVFDLVVSTLKILDRQRGVESAYIVNSFEIQLMKLLGYEMSLDKCSICGKSYSAAWNEVKFDISIGGIYCDTCVSRGILISRQAAEILQALNEHKYKKTFVLRDLNVVDTLVKNYVAGILGGEVKTRRVYGI